MFDSKPQVVTGTKMQTSFKKCNQPTKKQASLFQKLLGILLPLNYWGGYFGFLNMKNQLKVVVVHIGSA